MKSWGRLVQHGALAPVAATTLDASALPPSIVSLLATHGPGWLFGLFAVGEPGSQAWGAWQDAARFLRERGFFTGVPASAFATLLVFARDPYGHALAVSHREGEGESFYLLTCGGSVVFLGDAVDAMLDALPAQLRLLFPLIEDEWDAHLGRWVPKHDWGLDPSFVSHEVHGGAARRAYLEACSAGADADAMLPQATASEPFALAVHALLADLCGSPGDGLSDEARGDAIQPLVAVVKRRFGQLPDVPEELFARTPWRSEPVRVWVRAGHSIGMRRGPFAEESATLASLPVVEPIPEDARPPFEAPRFDDAASLARWMESWDALAPAPALERVRGRLDALSAALRFATVRRLAWNRWTAEHSALGLDEATRVFVDHVVRHHRVDLGGAHLHDAWPLLLVLLVHATRFGYETNADALEAIATVRCAELDRALVALVEQGYEWPVRQGRLVNDGAIDDETLERLLPLLEAKGVREQIVTLVMNRIDDARVYESALKLLKKWPLQIAPWLVLRPLPRTLGALRAQLHTRKLESREAIAKALAELGDEEARVILEETSRRIDDSI